MNKIPVYKVEGYVVDLRDSPCGIESLLDDLDDQITCFTKTEERYMSIHDLEDSPFNRSDSDPDQLQLAFDQLERP